MSATKLILVIGATGAQGLAVIDALLAPDANGKPSPYSVRALTRDTAGRRALELSSFEDREAVAKAFEGVYGVWVNTDGPTVGEIREILAGFRPEYRAGHMNGKGLVADWLRGQISTVSPDGLAWTIVETLLYTEMIASARPIRCLYHSGIFEPLNVRADGTAVFALPAGRAKIPLVTLKDLGWWARYTFDHRTETAGQDLRIGSHVVGVDEIVETFTKVTGKPAVYKPQSVEEWWNNFGSGVNRFLGSSSMTVKQNFSGFWKTFGDELVKRDLDWVRSVHPGTQTLEDWMRENKYTGAEGTVLKSREDHGNWGLNEEVTTKL
ncbi:NAD-P-binding protein [Mycena olivaceomarginata]|nr:NAD-P-binding protein [Mycena olivaceomarginata]